MLRLIINLFFLFLYNFSFSQTSELGRFTVNVKNGCLPLEIEIVSENLDTSISVVLIDVSKFSETISISRGKHPFLTLTVNLPNSLV